MKSAKAEKQPGRERPDKQGEIPQDWEEAKKRQKIR
jgi:hypothetical protein